MRDAFGNLCQCGGSDNSINLDINFTHSDGTMVDPTSNIEINGGSGTGNGIFKVKYNLTQNGVYTPTIKADGTSITGLGTFTISNAIASASYSYIRGWEGGAASTITSAQTTIQYVQLQDIYQNNITDNGGYDFYVTLLSVACACFFFNFVFVVGWFGFLRFENTLLLLLFYKQSKWKCE